MSVLFIILISLAITTLIALIYAFVRIAWISRCFSYYEYLITDYYVSTPYASIPDCLDFSDAFRDADEIINTFYRWDKWFILKDEKIIQLFKEHEKVMKERENDTAI